MARGWESKAIESQQQDALATRPARPELTDHERSHLDRQRGLELALARTQAELQAAGHPAYREMLRLRLTALQAELGTI